MGGKRQLTAITRRRMAVLGIMAARGALGQGKRSIPQLSTDEIETPSQIEFYKLQWHGFVEALNKFADRYNAGVYDARLWAKYCKAMDALRGCRCK